MSSLTNNATIKVRRDTASNWSSTNPTPKQGELCYELGTTKPKLKIGDGVTAYNDLDYAIDVETVQTEIDGKLTGSTDQICKAWVNFDGTTNTIRDSYNVSSITDNGTGDYTINFTNDMNNANYSIVAMSNSQQVQIDEDAIIGVSGFTVETKNSSGTSVDSSIVCVSIFGS